MKEQDYVARSRLLDLVREHPDWTHEQLAEQIGYSIGWVRKWRARFKYVAQPELILKGWPRRPRRAKTEPLSIKVIERILDIRDHPPANLKRVPGPKAILYYLRQDEDLKAQGVWIPRSQRRVWQVLAENHKIDHKLAIEHQPLPRPAPMTGFAIDFKDIATVKPMPNGEGKQAHVAEALNIVDEGTSILVDNPVRGDFNAETVLRVLADSIGHYGMPEYIRCDRDPRFVGHGMNDFPSAFIRFFTCLGIRVEVGPPHRPDLNPFVERLNGTYNQECLKITLPKTLEEAVAVSIQFKTHYNWERPHQGLSCGNVPPRTAFPVLPLRPRLPDLVNPDGWLERFHQKPFLRRVRSNGSVTVDKYDYYVSAALRGKVVLLQINAVEQVLQVIDDDKVIKTIPIKGLLGSPMRIHDFLDMMCEQARSEERRLQYRHIA